MIEIVNVNKAWGIGKAGDLLINIPADMKYFRETTRGAVVIMGSTTLDSFPGMAPLKDRVNIVLVDDDAKIRREALFAAAAAKKQGLSTELIYVHSPEEAAALGREYESAGREVFVIGGASIYRIMLPYCDTALVTVNDCEREADTFYPDLEADPAWHRMWSGEMQEHEGVHFCFTRWERR